MITRIVKLTFQEDKMDEFLAFFETIKFQVNSFPGCGGMKLLRDKNHPNIVLTYSNWESEDSLNNYRDSEVFGKVWPTIKPWFTARPEAWTTAVYFDGFEVINTKK